MLKKHQPKQQARRKEIPLRTNILVMNKSIALFYKIEFGIFSSKSNLMKNYRIQNVSIYNTFY